MARMRRARPHTRFCGPAARGRGLTGCAMAGRLPWWGWLGGVIGPAHVVAVFLLLPEIGAATVGLTVAGQQLASLVVDQLGLLRLPRRPLTRTRLAGVALLLGVVALIQLT